MPNVGSKLCMVDGRVVERARAVHVCWSARNRCGRGSVEECVRAAHESKRRAVK